jgi:hypothetical protein
MDGPKRESKSQSSPMFGCHEGVDRRHTRAWSRMRNGKSY